VDGYLGGGVEESLPPFCARIRQAVPHGSAKKEGPHPSEAFSQLLAEKLVDVERAFQFYVRRKEELLTYLKTTARRSESTMRTSAGSVVGQPLEADSPRADTELAAS
jgi:hypothetical protein